MNDSSPSRCVPLVERLRANRFEATSGDAVVDQLTKEISALCHEAADAILHLEDGLRQVRTTLKDDGRFVATVSEIDKHLMEAVVPSETNAHRELIRDASRYRWLREAKFLEIVTDNQMFRIAGGDNLDKTIDVAATP